MSQPRVKLRTGMALALAIALGGCASSNAPQTYDFSAPAGAARPSGAQRGQLMIIEPKAIASLDTERIAVRGAGGAFSYLSDGAWADRLPKLMQARLIQAFENASRLRSVGRPGDRLASDYQLLTELRAFELETGGGPQARVEVSVKLVNDRTGRIMAAQVFAGRAAAAGTDAANVSAAFNQAAQGVMRDIVAWVTAKI